MSRERISVVESHTGGEPFRVVTGGVPQVPGATMIAKRAYAETHLDGLRRLLMLEPRGHADMYGCFMTDAVSPGADFGVLFMHNAGFSTMCGHGIIAMTTVAVETAMVPLVDPVTHIGIDTPAGLIRASARIDGGRVESVSFINVPSFASGLDQTIAVPGVGQVRYDLGFGGAFYAYVESAPLGLELVPERVDELISVGQAIKLAVAGARTTPHPFEPALSFVYGTIFTGPAQSASGHSRHVCVFADGEVDRSPTGTGVAGRLAILSARGVLAPRQRIVIESIVGSEFGGEIVETTMFGPHAAVIPRVDGRAYLTGRAEFWAETGDRLGEGFLLGTRHSALGARLTG